ncbi:hypothetical protein [Burkholderia ubonensis]|uniref:hypothetical protein n=1 Tax=Burkholderia ubonensis TaxID=101571 RepID=UPI0012FA3B2A|nr:hypothetical protein [Burkholderia ubonensis]
MKQNVESIEELRAIQIWLDRWVCVFAVVAVIVGCAMLYQIFLFAYLITSW